MNHKLESRLLGEISTTSDIQMNITLMAENEEELRNLLIRVKEEGEKILLKLNIEKTKLMASDPSASWQIEVGKMEAVTDFIFLGSKITADGDYSCEIKLCLLPWKESYDKTRWHIKKQRHHFANKGPSSQSYGFSSSHVWMWKLSHKEGWAPKNWCFQIVVLEKTLKSPLDSKETKPVNPQGNQPWIFVVRTDAESEAQYFGHLMQRTDLMQKTLMLGKIEGKRRRGQQRMRWLDSITNSMNTNFSRL